MNSFKTVFRGLAAAALLFAGSASADSLIGVNPFNNTPAQPGLLIMNPDTGAVIGGHVVVVPGRTINAVQGIATDPTTGISYAIARAVAVAGRLLIRISPSNGHGAEIGNLGDNFSSIAFRNDGQLFGVTGDGATVPETLFLINKDTAATTLATALGNGADGEVIAYHPPSNSFFHWSGGGVIFFERIDANAPYTVTNVPITGSTTGEVFGAVWNPAIGQFQVHNISSVMDFWTPTGVRSNTQAATTFDVRGMILFAAPLALASQVPTLGEWAMLLLALLMAGVAMRALSGRGAPNSPSARRS